MSLFRRSQCLAAVALACVVLVGSAGWLMSRTSPGVPVTGPIEADLGGDLAVVFPDGSVAYLRSGGVPAGGRLPASTWAQLRRLLAGGRLASEDEGQGGCLDGGFFYGLEGPHLSVSWMLCSSAGGPSSPVRIKGAPTLSRVLTLLAIGDRRGLDPLPELPGGPPARALTVARTWVNQSPEQDGVSAVTRTTAPLTVDVTTGGDVRMRDRYGRVVGGRHLDRATADALRLLLSAVPAAGPGPVALTCTTTRNSPGAAGPLFVPQVTSCQASPGSASSPDWRALNWLAVFVDLALTP